jgi:hypothetical protein
MALQIEHSTTVKKIMDLYYTLPQAPFTSENILTEIDAEIVKLQTELIS